MKGSRHDFPQGSVPSEQWVASCSAWNPTALAQTSVASTQTVCRPAFPPEQPSAYVMLLLKKQNFFFFFFNFSVSMLNSV